jgi:hypothetical protein
VCIGQVDSQSLQPEETVERLLPQGVHTVEEFQILGVYLKKCRKECVQEFSPKDLRIFQSNSGGIGSSKLLKKSSRELVP